MTFRFIEEIATADIAFEAENKTLSGLFRDCAMAAAESMADTKTVAPAKKKKIKLKNSDVEKLLFDFLEEIIFIKDRDAVLFSKFDIKVVKVNEKKSGKGKTKNKNFSLDCTAYCDRISQKKQKLRNDVKAVTLHKFRVEKIKKNSGTAWKAMIILDI